MDTPQATNTSRLTLFVKGALLVGLALAAAWGLDERGVGEGTELRVLTRASSGLSEGALAWGGLPLEGPLPSRIVGAALYGSPAWGLGGVRVASFLFACLGVAATYAAVRALFDAHAARGSALVLATLPLYAMHAGTLLPDTITFASGAIAFAAFAVIAHGPTTVRVRVACIVVGAVFVALGVATRGFLVGACVPLAPMIAAALSGSTLSRRVRLVFASAFVVAAFLGVRELGPARESAVTFDVPLATAMHELFPWSCGLPLAWSCLVRGARAKEASRGLAASILVGLGMAYAVHLLAARAGAKVPFVAPYLVAMAVGVAARDTDYVAIHGARRTSPSALLASFAFAFLLARDAWLFPETALVPFSFVKLPVAVIPRLSTIVPLVAITWGIGLLVLSSPRAVLARFVPPGTWFLGWGTAGALLFLLVHHRAVQAATSPRGAVDAYHVHRTARSQLGLLGVSEKAARVTGETSVTPLGTAEEAARWLGDDREKFVAARREHRAELSAFYRSRYGKNIPEVPVEGASDTLLFAGALPPASRSQNPLDLVVLNHRPDGYFSTPATFSVPVSAEGVRLEDTHGRAVGSVSSGFEGTLKVLYRARGAVPSGYCSFVHVDVRPTRAASEERDFAAYPTRFWREGDYVVVAHAVKIPHGAAKGRAEIGFGLGVLPCTDDRRADVVSGRHAGNRVYGGSIDVR